MLVTLYESNNNMHLYVIPALMALNLTLLTYLEYSCTEPTICASLYFSLLGIISNFFSLSRIPLIISCHLHFNAHSASVSVKVSVSVSI